MRWHKSISTLLHPLTTPVIVVLIYFMLTPFYIDQKQQYTLLSIVFISTYIIPLLIFVFLKTIGNIKDYQLDTNKERKIPVFFMILLFFILGRTFYNITIIRDISYFFQGTTIALTIVYLSFFIKKKINLYLLSMSSAIGFILTLGIIYNTNITGIIIIFIILSGLLGSSRLYLQKSSSYEVYLGFFTGLISQLAVFFYYL